MTGAALAAHVRVARGAYVLDAQLQVDAGGVVAVMGPSGAGKSTLFGAIAGFVPLQAGEVRLDGRIVDAATGPHVSTHTRGVVTLGQQPRLFPHLSARDNVAFGLRAHRVPRAAAGREADVWLERVGLAGLGARRPAHLSGGQQQRVALARAMATRPRLLLLDEPMSSLDPETAAGIRQLLREQLAQEGTTALVATHEAVDAASLAAQLLILEHGTITQRGAVRDVLQTPRTAFAAAIAGVQRIPGTMAEGLWRDDTGQVVLDAAGAADGPRTIALLRPSQVEVVPAATGAASQPGQWMARITRLEPTPVGVRVHTDGAGVAADVSAGQAAEESLAPGAVVVLRVRSVRFAAESPPPGGSVDPGPPPGDGCQDGGVAKTR